MPVMELLVSAFLTVLLERLTSPELLRFLSQEGLYSKIKKWEDTLKIIQAVLGDAEQKQLKDRAVKTWLDDLQDLAYDVEDILDEFSTEAEACARKLKMEQHDQPSTSKIRKFFPSCFRNLSPRAIKFNRGMESQIKDVSSRFEHLCSLRESLGLKENNAGGTSSNAAPRRTPSSSVKPEQAIYGRDGDKKKILEMVLNDDANFRVIPIVGMGGVGKTTLAREVYNDTVVQSFELKAWVCVSDDYDVLRVSNAILEYISGSPSDLKELSTAQNKLKEKVKGRKLLLVLDDVWRMNYGEWESLKSPFMAGARGSRMIVTTRIGGVASIIRPSGFYQLNELPGEDCWSVFSMHAFENGVIPAHAPGNIKLIRQKVIERSKGLPLAARSLGGLLRSMKEEEWLVFLNSKIWDLSKEGDNEVPAALKLSYHHLPSHLKRCFAYCAIFPKDYEFEEEELVLLWMAEGLIQQSTKDKHPEDFGGEYFYDLLSRSIFQQSSSNRSKFTMHDLVHDVAQWAFGEIILRVEDVIGDDKKLRGLDKVRYFSYTADLLEGKNKFEDLDEVESLRSRIRTFLPIFRNDFRYYGHWYITDVIIFDLLPKLKRLRALSLRNYYITEVPNSVGGLRHLRYLNLSGTEIISLPESTSLLYNLQILMLRGCSRLGKLPSNFRYLIKLRHLDIKGAISIKEMPSGMKELESLQKLSNFILGKDVGSNLQDLKSLKMLRGELCILGLDNVVDCDVRDLILRDKDLKELLLEWGSQFDDSRNPVVEKNVLEMLRPNQHLEKLTIRCYGGTTFPSWVGDSSFSNVTVLRLQSCEKCISLPSLGLLGMLKDLTIKGMEGLRHLSCEIYGEGCKKPFRLLETLCFEDMPQWENWEPVKENEYVDAFPWLRELTIVNCPNLSRRLPDCLPSLEKLVINNCKLLVVSFSSLPLRCKLEIDGCKGLACNSPTDSKSLKSMTLADISEFGDWMRPPQGLQSVISITELRIENCSNLISFPEVCFLVNLSSLEIINCDALTSLPKGMNDKNACLGSLKMKDCNSLTFIVRGKLPSSLKKLEIENCKKLEYLWDDNEESCTLVVDEEYPNNTSTSLLEYLHVRECPSLKCLSFNGTPLPKTLQHLYIKDCSYLLMLSSSGHLPQMLHTLSLDSLPDLESIVEISTNKSLEEISVMFCLGEEGPPNTNLSELRLFNCEKLEALPNWFHSLNSLKSLTLIGCPMYKAVFEWGLHNLTSLTSLKIWGSYPQQEMEMTFPPSLTHLHISSFPTLKCLMGEGFRNLNSLESLSINGFPNLTSFPELAMPSSLKSLWISSCPNLTSFPELALPSSLKSLLIDDCPNLTSLPELALPSSLNSLSIHGCPNLTSLPELALPSSLNSLSINGCPNLSSFPKLALPSSLKSLSIYHCPNLKSFSKLGLPSSLAKLLIFYCPKVRSFPKQGLPSSLLELDIYYCPKLKEECKRDKGKKWSKISHIPRVYIDGTYIDDPLCFRMNDRALFTGFDDDMID